MAKCVVLHTSSEYRLEHEAKLRELLSQKLDLLAVVGVDCRAWEDAIDWLIVESDSNGQASGCFCNTTSHPDETVEDVIEFAKHWSRLGNEMKDVQVVEI